MLSGRRNKIGKNENETKSGTKQSETCFISKAVPENPERIVTLPKLNKPMKNRFGTYRFCSVLRSKIAFISYSRLPPREVVWNARLYVERAVSYSLHYSHNFATHCLLTSKIRKIKGKVHISHRMSCFSAVFIRHFATMHDSQFVLEDDRISHVGDDARCLLLILDFEQHWNKSTTHSQYQIP
jgi:hypothetical protein